MKVILSQDVVSLGEEGDVRDVRDGYARNYLIPQGYAVPYTKQNLLAARNDGRLPFTKSDKEGRACFYDIDDPKVQALIKEIPRNMSAPKKEEAILYREEFLRKNCKRPFLLTSYIMINLFEY